MNLKFQKNIFKIIFIFFIAFSIAYANLPALSGHLINDKMKIKYPDNYFQLFKWLETQPQQSRIVKMPINTYWGWVYHNWPLNNLNQGYQGAGFTWFGISQPTLDREFDRWVNTNEFFYHEVENDLTINNGKNLTQIFQKYNISYILVDKSSIDTSKSNIYQSVKETESILINLGLQIAWEDDFLKVYKLNDQYNFINVPISYTKVKGNTEQVRIDTIFQNEKNYIDEKSGLIYPFEKFSAEDVDLIQYQTETISLKSHNNNSSGIYQIQVDENVDLVTLPVKIDYQNDQLSIQFTNLPLLKIDEKIIKPKVNPSIQIDTGIPINELIVDVGLSQLKIKQNEHQISSVVVPSNKNIDIIFFDATKISTSSGRPTIIASDISKTSTTILPKDLFLPSELISLKNDSQISLVIPKDNLNISLPIQEATNCGDTVNGSVANEYKESIYKYEANKKGVNCSSLILPLLNRQTYLLHVKGNNLEGRSIKLFISDDTSENIIFEELLPEGKFDKSFTVFTPDSDTFQYRLNLETRSFGQKSVNEISQLEIYPLPLSFIINSKLVPQNTVYKFNNNLIIKNNWKMGTDRYGFEAINDQKTNQLFSLSQSYDPTWIAIALPQNSLKIIFLEHHKYNGWANSWFLPPGKYNVYIFYIPQIVSFQAMIITAICLVWFILKIIKNKVYPRQRKYKMVQQFLLGDYHKKVM